MTERPDWDEYLMTLAHLVAVRSHDTQTQHGAVIVDANHRILGIGYNGLPRGGDESRFPDTRPDKYEYMVHAELNAILNCTLRPEGGALYVTGCPCPKCMLTIIQAGIIEIIHGDRNSHMVGTEQLMTVNFLANVYKIRMRKLPRGRVLEILQDVIERRILPLEEEDEEEGF